MHSLETLTGQTRQSAKARTIRAGCVFVFTRLECTYCQKVASHRIWFGGKPGAGTKCAEEFEEDQIKCDAKYRVASPVEPSEPWGKTRVCSIDERNSGYKKARCMGSFAVLAQVKLLLTWPLLLSLHLQVNSNSCLHATKTA